MPRPRRWTQNDRLVFERERHAWSQDDAARRAEQVAERLGLGRLGFTGAQFGRWERGECRPRPPYLGVVCELYEASAEDLGLCGPPSLVLPAVAGVAPAPEGFTAVLSPLAALQEAEPRTQGQEVKITNRREAIKHAIALGAGVVVGGHLLDDAADASVVASRKWSVSGVDPMTLEELDQDVERFARDYYSIPHAHLFPEVWEDRNLSTSLRQVSQEIAERTPLDRRAC